MARGVAPRTDRARGTNTPRAASRGRSTLDCVRNSYSLGRVAGIEIGLNWSVLGLLALLMWTLATAVFPATNPAVGDNGHFAMAVAASLGFFASILLHEMGHALQARRDGMHIDGITLWLFGGVARFRGMFPSAGAELRIAVAGPAVSLVLGAAALGTAAIPGIPSAVDGVSAWLGVTNLALLLFNLIPALPLDGGRMLRAAIWSRTGDLPRATHLAAACGRVLALGLIGVGVLVAIVDQPISGIWLAFIGWFVLQAAGAETRYVDRRQGGRELRVGDVMVHRPVTTEPDRTLSGFAGSALRLGRHPAYPVLQDGVPVGLLALRRVTEVPPELWDRRRVREVMLPRAEVPTLAADDALNTALEALRGTAAPGALVLDGDALVGLLSPADLARALAWPGPGGVPL